MIHCHARAFRYDPTRTRGIVSRMEGELRRRFMAYTALIKTAIVDNDILNGGPLPPILQPTPRPPLRANAAPVLGTLDWLRQAQHQTILGNSYGVPMTAAVPRSWMNPYLQSVYKLALVRAGNHVKSVGGQVTTRWLGRAHQDRVHVLGANVMYTRAYAALENIAAANNAAILRSLQQAGLRVNADEDDDARALVEAGIAGGKGMRAVATEIAAALGVGFERALTLARTETIAIHAEATLNAFEEAGMYGVTVDAEFATAGDDKVCEECNELSGQTFSIAEARGVIPVHPRCRCAWLPVVQGATGELK